MTYNFHPAARAEYREAAGFYESRRSGLGAAFSIEVEGAISRILQAPNRWPVIEQDVRRCLTHTFPYGILYTIEPDLDSNRLGYALAAKARLLARPFIVDIVLSSWN